MACAITKLTKMVEEKGMQIAYLINKVEAQVQNTDYINRWLSLSLDCKDRLSKVSAVEMCIQGMHWGFLYIFQGIRPHTFEELATRAHDMELSIANHGSKKDLVDRQIEIDMMEKGVTRPRRNPSKSQ
uniref:Uncharacterized protein n=1 Tax=Vitis vinifera TaxID=29760 RepID=A5BY32_VITVI|nr:hypothetical protein VITISV_002418 [Vitis vinifera]